MTDEHFDINDVSNEMKQAQHFYSQCVKIDDGEEDWDLEQALVYLKTRVKQKFFLNKFKAEDKSCFKIYKDKEDKKSKLTLINMVFELF